jgi:hypothetical protein NreA
MDRLTPHRSHPAIANRLKRAEGHLRAIVAMIESGRSCLEIAQQMHAVEKAIGEAKRRLVADHLEGCLDAALGSMSEAQRREIEDVKAIARYL